MAPEDVDYLRDAGLGLDSELRIVEGRRVVCCVGLLTTLYFKDGGTSEARERLALALDLYLRAAAGGLVWGASASDPDYRAITSSNATRPRSWAGSLGPQEALTLKLSGARDPGDASPYFATVKARSLAPRELSYMSFGLPFAWIADRPPGAFTQLVVDVCDALAPTHGYAGLAAIGSVELRRSEPGFAAVIALVSRFRGLEVDIPQSHGIYLAKENRIKGINWLTALDQSWIDRLGGSAALAAALGEGIEMRPFRTGMVIQAGPRPLLGDVNRNEPMPAYQAVARALKPIRIASVLSISDDFGFDEDRSDKWLARFD
jgi:hypothetical protein